MTRIRLKRDKKSIVKTTSLLSGELAAAIDTGDVYVGITDGVARQLRSEELEPSISFNDDPIENILVESGIIGPLPTATTEIIMADGHNFVELLISGQLDGTDGAKGSTGDIGDAGLPGTNGIDAKDPYDQVIRTQAEFDALIASPTWLDAKSVCFVGDGGTLMFTRSDGLGCLIPHTVRQIQGMNNAIIEVTKFKYDALNKAALWYATIPGTNGYSVSNMEIRCHPVFGSGNGLANCTQVTDCICVTPMDYSFSECNKLVNCVGSGFYKCDQLVGCVAGAIRGSSEIGFKLCNQLVGCVANCTGTSSVIGFSDCVQLTNCTGNCECDDVSIGGGAYAFTGCTLLINCIGDGTSIVEYGNASGFSYCTQLTNCAGSGWGTVTGYSFDNCSYLNGCKQGSAASTTGFLGGTNTKVDALTVLAS